MTELRNTPGALEHTLRRELPDGGVVEFEFAPAGWLTAKGEPRLADHRAYYYTPPRADCATCQKTGRIPGRRPAGRRCPDCAGQGWIAKRSRLPSVTTLLDAVCPKPGLPVWAEARGIEGALEAVRRGLLDPEDPRDAVRVVRGARLGADRARDEAADRGLDVHGCLSHYMVTSEPPNPAEHPAAHFGYLRALTRWLLAFDPEPEAVEEVVVHPEDGYAGRLDLRARAGALRYTIDAKTQQRGGIYLGAHAQVNLYERAAVRCGSEPADRLLVVVFAADGEFRQMPADHPPAFAEAALAWARAARPVDSYCESQNRIEREARREVAA